MGIRIISGGLLIAGTIAPISFIAAPAASASPSCGAISSSVVQSTLGLKVKSPTSKSGSNSYYGFNEKTLTCKYVGSKATVYLAFGTPATSANFSKFKASLGGLAVPGLGSAAFKTVSYDSQHKEYFELAALVTGKAIITVNAPNVTSAGEVALMKKAIAAA